MNHRRVSLGIAGELGAKKAAALAPRLEEAGFRTLWINETPGTNALEVAAAAARETESLRVATGVIPIDRRSVSELLDDLDRLDLPTDRLTLGIGSGQMRRGALAAVEQTLAELRAGTDARLALGALGPRMRELAARHADALVLNWLTPEAAREQSEAFHAVQPAGEVVLYARTNADPSARARLEEEADRYGGYPAYAAHFARLGVTARETVLPPEPEGEIAPRLGAYTAAVDEVVLRAITPGDRTDEFLAFLPLARARA
ncbi:LLM class flavin-dependent oxidoreductase [Microbacterium excoecariae]|uniref:LLM class flavin-dependent oxidoreductase n=1 Tax=Microbacterium excoecariae TaxID=2715210 RepID=UPI00140836E2|nr:LLM class flavin-dependent oxidoreductase [Microbacterium excoecariae]NHI16018.1 LLM class flavin-dependent oxidoreductase [Microbacterium excoecariae]